MKMTASIVIMASLVGSASMSATANDMVGLDTTNGKLAAKIIDLWFNQGKPAEVFDKYISKTDYFDHYGEHTTNWAQTRADEVKMTPSSGFDFRIRQLVAQGDLVFMHMQVGPKGATGNGDEMVMVLRFKDHLLTETWNIHVPIQQDPALFFGPQRPTQPGYNCANGTCQATRPPQPGAADGAPEAR